MIINMSRIAFICVSKLQKAKSLRVQYVASVPYAFHADPTYLAQEEAGEDNKMEPDWATLAITPGGTAPAGMTSNLIDPVSRAWNVQLTIGITLIPALLLVVLRIYARLVLARSLWIDDCTSFLDVKSPFVYVGS
ncbi:hypothetical protein ONZ43_g3108 [Nemania bipapillata]|uniref:Uncharacterized protein n=1 Tax=Nemania bipapillata TaxID=110536 RepID=A0ACC2IXZ0_9PEZI|nr:hypothetical protein ONZ43_g3108 [Nemania bipapillata]